ncbi:hypothetical protein BGZ49_009827 [Haplosporangium sp. Z 27]|nr:hypothetical protein BGZ49_009827 [Haplosporangium sp. Z 27]
MAGIVICCMILGFHRAARRHTHTASRTSLNSQTTVAYQNPNATEFPRQNQRPINPVLFSRNSSTASALPLYVPRSTPPATPEMSEMPQSDSALPPSYADIAAIKDAKQANTVSNPTITVPAAAYHPNNPMEGPSVALTMP